jgi:hypothetical protein
MPGPLAVGDVIHGFAYGAFGRDHYHCVRIEAIGPDWIVARDSDLDEQYGPSFASGRRALGLCQQARDEGHRTPYGEQPQACPLAQHRPALTSRVVIDVQPDPPHIAEAVRDIRRHGLPPRR